MTKFQVFVKQMFQTIVECLKEVGVSKCKFRMWRLYNLDILIIFISKYKGNVTMEERTVINCISENVDIELATIVYRPKECLDAM